jgi:hypothetical protein
MVQPINYLANMPQVDIGESLIQGLQVGATFRQLQEQQAARQQAEQRLQAYRSELENAWSQGRPEAFERLMTLFPEHQAAVKPQYDRLSKVQQQNELSSVTNVRAAIETGNTQYAKQLIERQIQATENSNQDASLYKNLLEQIDIDPKMVASNIDYALSTMLGPKEYKEWAEGISKVGETRRAEAMAPTKLRQELAAADKAEVEARIKMETATDDIAKAKATRMFEEAKAKKEKVQADTELQTRLSEIGFKQAQINKFNVETRNLDTQGKMLSLDFQAALKGLPLPSKKTEGGGGAATEDERKAAGWLSQATNAYNNMLGAMYQKGKPTGAEKPGFFEAAAGTLPFIGEGSAAILRGTDRQKFVQASSSLSEALLRAATGAGVNKDEAEQKLKELTPLYTDDADTRKQKLAAIPVYLESLKVRAGRAAPSEYQVPRAPGETTQTSAANTATVGGKTYTRPANFTDAQWAQYKQEMGVK